MRIIEVLLITFDAKKEFSIKYLNKYIEAILLDNSCKQLVLWSQLNRL